MEKLKFDLSSVNLFTVAGCTTEREEHLKSVLLKVAGNDENMVLPVRISKLYEECNTPEEFAVCLYMFGRGEGEANGDLPGMLIASIRNISKKREKNDEEKVPG